MSIVTHLKALYKHPSVRSVGIYGFTNFFSKAASFFLLFIFTNPLYITPSENGLLSLFSTSMLFLMPFLSMGIIHSVSADYYKMDKHAFRDFFTTGFIMPFAVMIISIGALFLFRHPLQRLYGFPLMFIWLIPVVTFLIFCSEQLLSLARNNNEPAVYLKANVSKTVLELGLSFVLVVYFAARWQGRVSGILVAYTVTALYALYYFIKKKYLFGSIKKEFIYSELLYAIPIITMQVSIFALNASDKFFLSNFTSDNNETVGIYSIACVFASIINVLSMALLQYIFPRIFTLLSAENINYQLIKNQFIFYGSVMLAGLVCITVFTPVLYHYFINEKYHAALEYNYLLCIGYFLWAISYFFYSFLLYHKQKRKILMLSLCCIVISLLCNYLFIGRWGARGAAVAVFTAYALVFMITLFFTRSHWKNFFMKS